MENNAVAVYTRESRSWITDHGCTGNWYLGPKGEKDWGATYRQRRITHAICCRNSDKGRPIKSGDIDDDTLESRAAFLVGRIVKIERVKDDVKGNPRHSIHLTDVTDIDRPNFWKLKHQRPEFRSIEELGLKEMGFPMDTEPHWKVKRDGASGSPGPHVGGLRSEATWEARHSPLVMQIASVLDKLECRSVNEVYWHPDLIRTTPSGEMIIIEVKPDSSRHNVITAIGQSICYRSHAHRPISVIAAPGIDAIDEHLAEVLKANVIHAVDLNEDFAGGLATLVKRL